MKKLFVFDIDGTLVNRSYELKQEVIDAINLLLESGHYVATCSGRSYIGSTRFLSQFKNYLKNLIKYKFNCSSSKLKTNKQKGQFSSNQSSILKTAEKTYF